MILSSCKQRDDISVRPALTSTLHNFAWHRRGSAAAAAVSLALTMLFILNELELIQGSGPDSAKQLSLTLVP